MSGKRSRSAISGRFVSNRYARSHPRTTVTEGATGAKERAVVQRPKESTAYDVSYAGDPSRAHRSFRRER
jgi:hypothetical protein